MIIRKCVVLLVMVVLCNQVASAEDIVKLFQTLEHEKWNSESKEKKDTIGKLLSKAEDNILICTELVRYGFDNGKVDRDITRIWMESTICRDKIIEEIKILRRSNDDNYLYWFIPKDEFVRNRINIINLMKTSDNSDFVRLCSMISAHKLENYIEEISIEVNARKWRDNEKELFPEINEEESWALIFADIFTTMDNIEVSKAELVALRKLESWFDRSIGKEYCCSNRYDVEMLRQKINNRIQMSNEMQQ